MELFERESQAPRRSTTAPDGSFGFEGLLPGAHVVLWIDREGPLATQRRESLPRVRGGALDLGTVVLDRGGVVRGRVVDEHGAPVAGATVSAYTPEELDEDPLRNGPVVDVWRSGEDDPWIVERTVLDAERDARIGRPATQSGEDGTFRLAGALRYDDRLLIRHSEHAPARAGPFAVHADRPCDAGDIVLGTGRAVHGVVVDAMQYGGSVDADGAFEVTGVIPGEYRADVLVRSARGPFDARREYEAEPIDFVVPPGGLDGLELRPEIRVLPSKAPFSGRIELPADVPQAVSALFLRRTDDPDATPRMKVRPDHGFEGRVPPGEYHVWCCRAGSRSRRSS